MYVLRLNEVKYFVIQGKDIPEVAMSLFNKAEAFRIQREQLATIKEKYNVRSLDAL